MHTYDHEFVQLFFCIPNKDDRSVCLVLRQKYSQECASSVVGKIVDLVASVFSDLLHVDVHSAVVRVAVPSTSGLERLDVGDPKPQIVSAPGPSQLFVLRNREPQPRLPVVRRPVVEGCIRESGPHLKEVVYFCSNVTKIKLPGHRSGPCKGNVL